MASMFWLWMTRTSGVPHSGHRCRLGSCCMYKPYRRVNNRPSRRGLPRIARCTAVTCASTTPRKQAATGVTGRSSPRRLSDPPCVRDLGAAANGDGDGVVDLEEPVGRMVTPSRGRIREAGGAATSPEATPPSLDGPARRWL